MLWKTPASPVPIRYIIGACAIIAVILWLRYAPPTAPWSPHQVIGMVMPEPRTITKIEKQDVPGPVRIRTIVKEKIVEKYRDLPTPATVADPSAQVIAVADIPPSPDGGVALAVLRPGADSVGVGTIEYRPATPKFWQVKKEFGVRAGMGTGGLVVGEVYVHPLRVGPINVEGRAFVNRDNARGADFGAAVLIDYRF